jgi:Tfp pilus assembly protein FimT
MKAVSVIFAALLATLGTASFSASAQEAKVQTVASVIQNKDKLGGKTVAAQGKVVKVNNGIMGRNFVHVQDGSGDAAKGTNNLIVTSTNTAAVGDQVTVSGTVALNREFGMGYSYPLLVENATIARK